MTPLRYGVPLESFEQLEDYLVHWRSFSAQDVYDPAGMMTLLCACVENLRVNVSEDEIADFRAGLSHEERYFLRALTDD